MSVFRNDLEYPIFAEVPIFVAQIPQGLPKVDSAEKLQILDWARVAGLRFTIGGSSPCIPAYGEVRSPRRREPAHGCCSGGSDGTTALGRGRVKTPDLVFSPGVRGD